MRGYKKDAFGNFHPVEVPDVPYDSMRRSQGPAPGTSGTTKIAAKVFNGVNGKLIGTLSAGSQVVAVAIGPKDHKFGSSFIKGNFTDSRTRITTPGSYIDGAAVQWPTAGVHSGSTAKPTTAGTPAKPVQRPPNKPNKATGKATVTGPSARKVKAGFKPHKVSVPAGGRAKKVITLHKTLTQTKTAVTPVKRSGGPSGGGGPAPQTNAQGQPTGYVDASGNPLDTIDGTTPYENAIFADLDGSQWVGQISIYDGSFTSLEAGYQAGSALNKFNNPVANLVNGHVYTYSPIDPSAQIPPGGYYSDLIQVTGDLGVFSGGLPAGAPPITAAATSDVTQSNTNGVPSPDGQNAAAPSAQGIADGTPSPDGQSVWSADQNTWVPSPAAQSAAPPSPPPPPPSPVQGIADGTVSPDGQYVWSAAQGTWTPNPAASAPQAPFPQGITDGTVSADGQYTWSAAQGVWVSNPNAVAAAYTAPTPGLPAPPAANTLSGVSAPPAPAAGTPPPVDFSALLQSQQALMSQDST